MMKAGMFSCSDPTWNQCFLETDIHIRFQLNERLNKMYLEIYLRSRSVKPQHIRQETQLSYGGRGGGAVWILNFSGSL